MLKSDASRHLIAAMKSLAVHKPFFTAKVSEQLLDTYLAQPEREGSALTSRERGVVQLIAEGHTNKQIANLLNISLKTVSRLIGVRSCASWRYASRHFSRALCDSHSTGRKPS